MLGGAGELREVQGPLVLQPVGEDVAHGAAGLVEAQVEAVGVDLGAVCHLKHRLETDPFLTCNERGRKDGGGRGCFISTV